MFNFNLTPFSVMTDSQLFLKHVRHVKSELTLRFPVNLCSLARRDIRFCPSFGFNQVRCEKGVDHCWFSESSLACILDMMLRRTRPMSMTETEGFTYRRPWHWIGNLASGVCAQSDAWWLHVSYQITRSFKLRRQNVMRWLDLQSNPT